MYLLSHIGGDFTDMLFFFKVDCLFMICVCVCVCVCFFLGYGVLGIPFFYDWVHFHFGDGGIPKP